MNKPQPILALVLSMAAIFVYYTFINPPAKPAIKSPAQTISSTSITGDKPQSSTSTEVSTTAAIPVAATPAPLSTSGSYLLPAVDEVGPFIIYEGKETNIRLNIAKGTIDQVVLNNYHTTTSADSPHTDLYGGGATGQAFGHSLGLASVDGLSTYKLVSQKKENGSEIIALEAQADLVTVNKTFIFGRITDKNMVDIELSVTNKSSGAQIISPRVYVVHEQKKDDKKSGFFSFLHQPADLYTLQYLSDKSLKTEGQKWDKLADNIEHTGTISWAALTDRYFLSSLIAREISDKITVTSGKISGNYIYTSLSYGAFNVEPGKTLTQKYSGYFGPKKRDVLKAVGVGLEKSVDYGTFSFIAIPLLYLLILFHKFLGNWGLAIIALTFLVKMLLHPVNKKSMESMKAMQKLQPKLAEVREKFKNDKEKLNIEMMQLFKANNVNPMSGCLPLVMQMPIYFALYRVLWNAIELYHAPFFAFYKDLAAPDPYMISPILLGVFMMLQQKLTPSAASIDPVQQKMMMIMPLMFSGFMLFLPSGLVIYIFVNTLMSVIQQYMMHKEISGMDVLRKMKLLPQKS